MRRFTFLIVCFGTVLLARSQSYFTQVNYAKVQQPGLVLELPYNTDVAEGTILKKLQEIGYKPETRGSLFWKKNKINDFYVFTGVRLPELNNQTTDLYFKVDRKSKRERDKSIMYLLVSKGYDNFVSPQTDSATAYAARDFFNSFVSETEAFKLNKDIGGQENAVKDAEKRLSQLKDEETDLRKRLDQNASDQQKQQQEIEAQRAKLEELRGKLKNS